MVKAYYEQDGVTLYHGDNCDVLGTFARESVDLVVTSPPYDDLRSYSSAGLVVWRYDVPHEKKQEVIAELKAGGVKPASKSRVASPEIPSREVIDLSNRRDGETEPEERLSEAEGLRHSDQKQGGNAGAERLVETRETARLQGDEALGGISASPQPNTNGEAAAKPSRGKKRNVRQAVSNVEGRDDAGAAEAVSDGRVEGVGEVRLCEGSLHMQEVWGGAQSHQQATRASCEIVDGLPAATGGTVEPDNTLRQVPQVGTRGREYEDGVYRRDDIPPHLRRFFRSKDVEWDFYGVAWQLKRVLKPGGVIVWVVADATVDGSETGSSMEQALHFKRLGLNLWDTMIWDKGVPTTPTESRYYATWEYVFVISKGKPNALNFLEDRKNISAGSNRVALKNCRKEKREYGGKSFVTLETGRRFNLWTINPVCAANGHAAVFPERLARDHILSWSNPGDLVLDPFAGSGTTLKMAKETGRRAVGIEVNADYCDIIRARCAQGVLFGSTAPEVA